MAAGDREAFRELYIVYHRRLARFLTRLTRHYEIAEEIINDTLWVVWRKAGDFRGDSRVSTWIMGIAYRRALKTLRGSQPPARATPCRSRTNRWWRRTNWVQPRPASGYSLPCSSCPAEQRLALEFAYGYGHSCEEIALIMNCPVNTVKTRLFHARAKLRALLPSLAGVHPET